MAVQANIRSGYRARFGLIALFLLGWGLYCLYDGAYAYPSFNAHVIESREAQQRYAIDHGTNWGRDWPEYAREHHYALEPNKLKLKGSMLQYVMGGISLPLALLAGLYYLQIGRRWVRSDEEGLRTHRGELAKWEAIQSVDSSRWQQGDRRRGLHRPGRGAADRVGRLEIRHRGDRENSA